MSHFTNIHLKGAIMEQVIYNLYPIFKIFVILFAVVGAYATINNFLHILGRFGKDKLDNKKDMHAKDCDADIIQDLLAKYPAVQKDFILKTERLQNIENNQEIQEMREVLQELKATVEAIRSTQRGGL